MALAIFAAGVLIAEAIHPGMVTAWPMWRQIALAVFANVLAYYDYRAIRKQ